MAHQALIALLADGRFHSGQQLADALSISRAAVWGRVQKLEEVGLALDAVRGKGYRLRQPLDLFDAEKIAQAADMPQQNISLFGELDSTNRWLRESTDLPTGHVCLAEYQSAGRGRSGRSWAASWGGGVLMSMLWRMPMRGDLPSLSLVVGMVAAQWLRELDVAGVQVKWPNDLVSSGRKLGGILIEVSGEAQGQCQLVIGMGINHRQAAGVDANIDQPWVDCDELTQGALPGRSALAGGLILRLRQALHVFADDGFAAFQSNWTDLDALHGKQVDISRGAEGAGRAAGINADGALLVQTQQGLQSFQCGEVSVRAQ